MLRLDKIKTKKNSSESLRIKCRPREIVLRVEIKKGLLGGIWGDLLAGLRKRHAGERRGQGLRIHLAAGALQIVVLPRLRIRRLKYTKLHTLHRNYTRYQTLYHISTLHHIHRVADRK